MLDSTKKPPVRVVTLTNGDCALYLGDTILTDDESLQGLSLVELGKSIALAFGVSYTEHTIDVPSDPEWTWSDVLELLPELAVPTQVNTTLPVQLICSQFWRFDWALFERQQTLLRDLAEGGKTTTEEGTLLQGVVDFMESLRLELGQPAQVDTEAVLQNAKQAFWARVAQAHPEMASGDLPPEVELAVEHAMRQAIEKWVYFNAPECGGEPIIRGGHFVTPKSGEVVEVLDISRDEVRFATRGGGSVRRMALDAFRTDHEPFDANAEPYVIALFEAGDAPWAVPGYHQAHNRWNGWASPYFAKAAADFLTTKVEGLKYNAEIDSFVWEPDGIDEPEIYGACAIEIDGAKQKVYGIGTGYWCWVAYKDRSELPYSDIPDLDGVLPSMAEQAAPKGLDTQASASMEACISDVSGYPSLHGGRLTLEDSQVIDLRALVAFVESLAKQSVPKTNDEEHQLLVDVIANASAVLVASGLVGLSREG